MIRAATLQDRNAVVKILAASFNDNPAVNDTIITDKHRGRRLIALMEYVFDTGFARKGVFVTDDLSGAIVMYDPVSSPGKISDTLRQLKLVRKSIGWSRMLYATRKDKKMRSYRPATPHFYLQMIGTIPAAQGKGVGSEMLRFITEKSIAMNKPVYLETSVAKNVEMYRRKGFVIHGDWKIREDYHVHFMNYGL
jgi:GNAT superfamily N-acetyltransferase